jgi:hypothetical protein
MEKKDKLTIKSLEFLQDIINRHNSNSFSIKLFAITVFGVLMTLYAEKQNIFLVIVNIIITWMLWILDSKYFQNERKFRSIYNKIIDSNKNNDFKVFKYDIKAENNISFIKSFLSYSTILMYICLIIVSIVLLYIHIYNLKLILK